MLLKLTLRCAGAKEPHSPQRVATARVDVRDVSMTVRVDYGNLPEPPSETGAFRQNHRSAGHLTYRFVCSRCGFDLPIQQAKLAAVIVARNTAGESSIFLDELAAIVTK